MRKKIKDEPFIDLIYKYIRTGFSEISNWVKPTKVGLAQGETLSSILFNIYTHPFDVFVKDVLIPKYTKGSRKKANPEYTQIMKEYGKVVSTNVNTTILEDENSKKIYYVKCADDFLLGVVGPKNVCISIRNEIKFFLEESLSLTLNVKKSKIIHPTTERALFLGYNISCIPIGKKPASYDLKRKLPIKTTQVLLNAPIKNVVEKLRSKGFLNLKYKPTRNGRYINKDL